MIFGIVNLLRACECADISIHFYRIAFTSGSALLRAVL